MRQALLVACSLTFGNPHSMAARDTIEGLVLPLSGILTDYESDAVPT